MWVRGGVGGWAVSQPHLPGALQSLSLTLEMETLHVLAVYLSPILSVICSMLPVCVDAHAELLCGVFKLFFFDVPIAVTVVNYA